MHHIFNLVLQNHMALGIRKNHKATSPRVNKKTLASSFDTQLDSTRPRALSLPRFELLICLLWGMSTIYVQKVQRLLTESVAMMALSMTLLELICLCYFSFPC